jgi:hypothetical protein
MDSARLLHHLAQDHPGEAGPYLARMEGACIDTVLAEVFEAVDAPG